LLALLALLEGYFDGARRKGLERGTVNASLFVQVALPLIIPRVR
jgi:hypothetical protein